MEISQELLDRRIKILYQNFKTQNVEFNISGKYQNKLLKFDEINHDMGVDLMISRTEKRLAAAVKNQLFEKLNSNYLCQLSFSYVSKCANAINSESDPLCGQSR